MSSPESSSPDLFAFDPKAHAYRLKGIVVPGITKTLEIRGFYDKAWFTEESRTRGTEVHRACWFLAEDDLEWSTVKPEYVPRVQGFQAFLNDKRPELFLAEKPLYSTAYNFAGTPDFVFRVGGEWWIVDVKTGRAGLAAHLQTAGQKVLISERFPEVKTAKRFALELPEQGKYRLIPCPNPYDEAMFLTLVGSIHRQVNANELKL